MNTYYLINYVHYNDNTSQYGYGDFPVSLPYHLLTVEAETLRKAQNKAKKIIPSLCFSGNFGDRLYTNEDLKRCGIRELLTKSEAIEKEQNSKWITDDI